MNYTQYGPITNGGVTARPDATIHYRTILRVMGSPLAFCYLFIQKMRRLQEFPVRIDKETWIYQNFPLFDPCSMLLGIAVYEQSFQTIHVMEKNIWKFKCNFKTFLKSMCQLATQVLYNPAVNGPLKNNPFQQKN